MENIYLQKSQSRSYFQSLFHRQTGRAKWARAGASQILITWPKVISFFCFMEGSIVALKARPCRCCFGIIPRKCQRIFKSESINTLRCTYLWGTAVFWSNFFIIFYNNFWPFFFQPAANQKLALFPCQNPWDLRSNNLTPLLQHENHESSLLDYLARFFIFIKMPRQVTMQHIENSPKP